MDDDDIANMVVERPKSAPKGISRKRMIALRERGLGAPAIGKILGCNPSNVTAVLTRYGVEQRHIAGYKESRADVFAGLQDRLLSGITDAEIQKMAVRDRFLCAGIIFDKEQLVRGLPTSIGVSVMVDLIEAIRAMDR